VEYKYKTKAVMRSTVFEPDKKAIALSHESLRSQGQPILPQSDLLYVRSVLVTAGMNANDDVFYNRELWNARYSPILKPLNWGHNEDEIIGVMYNVMARDLETGENIPMDLESYDKPFELITEGVVYKWLFPDRAEEVVTKAQADELFVSMETWFNDYDYSVFKDGRMDRIIKRDASTAFLDTKLRAFNGDGVFDFDNGEQGRIGRGLIGVHFGGCGFVFCPANDRSVIEAVGCDPETANADELNGRILRLLDVLEAQERDGISVNTCKEVAMKDEKVVADVVKTAISDLEAEKAAERDLIELREKADKAEALEQEVQHMKSAFQTINQSLNNLLGRFTDTMKVVEKTLGEAPPEIKKIDDADTGEEAFTAKIAWIEQSMAMFQSAAEQLDEKAAEAEEMRKQLDEIAWTEKADKIKTLLSDYVDADKLDEMMSMARELADEEFNAWYGEKESLVEGVKAKHEDNTEAAEKKDEEYDEEEDEKKKKDMKKEKAEEETAVAEEAETEEEDKEDNADEAESDATEAALEDVEVEDKPNISNASQEDEEEDPQGMKKVVAAIYESPDKQEIEEEKPGFDPVT